MASKNATTIGIILGEIEIKIFQAGVVKVKLARESFESQVLATSSKSLA